MIQDGLELGKTSSVEKARFEYMINIKGHLIGGIHLNFNISDRGLNTRRGKLEIILEAQIGHGTKNYGLCLDITQKKKDGN